MTEGQFGSILLFLLAAAWPSWTSWVTPIGLELKPVLLALFYGSNVWIIGSSLVSGIRTGGAKAVKRLCPILCQVFVAAVYARHKPAHPYMTLATLGLTCSYISCRYIVLCLVKVDVPVVEITLLSGVPSVFMAALHATGSLDGRAEIASVLHGAHFMYILMRLRDFVWKVVEEFRAYYGIRLFHIPPAKAA